MERCLVLLEGSLFSPSALSDLSERPAFLEQGPVGIKYDTIGIPASMHCSPLRNQHEIVQHELIPVRSGD